MRQNKIIEMQIRRAQLYFFEPLLQKFEIRAREYLKASEATWKGSDEKAIREEIERISSDIKPYFDSNHHILELEAFRKLR